MRGQTVKRIYMNVNLGRIREKCAENTKGVEIREDKEGKKHFEIVYNFIIGVLEDVFFQTHPEYGNSYKILCSDGEEHYSIQVNEDSAYGRDLLKKLPGMLRGEIYKFAPFQFTPADSTKERVGLTIIRTADDVKLQTCYQTFEQKEDKSWKVTNVNGFPDYTGKPKDKDDLKVYYIQVTKFLRERALAYLKGDFITKAKAEVPVTIEPDVPLNALGQADPSSDLPF